MTSNEDCGWGPTLPNRRSLVGKLGYSHVFVFCFLKRISRHLKPKIILHECLEFQAYLTAFGTLQKKMLVKMAKDIFAYMDVSSLAIVL